MLEINEKFLQTIGSTRYGIISCHLYIFSFFLGVTVKVQVSANHCMARTVHTVQLPGVISC